MAGYFSKKFDEWYRKPETKAKLVLAKENAWNQLTKQYPNADKTKFKVQTSVDDNYKISAEVFLKEGSGDFAERVWLRQKVLEPANEERLRFGCRWLPLSANSIKNKKSIANPRS